MGRVGTDGHAGDVQLGETQTGAVRPAGPAERRRQQWGWLSRAWALPKPFPLSDRLKALSSHRRIFADDHTLTNMSTKINHFYEQ